MNAKIKNRIKSYIYIAVFLVSLVVAGVVTGVLIKNIKHNNELIAIKNQLLEEKEHIKDGDEQDCYTVYVKDDYSLVDGEVYIFKK